jgi:DNA-binding NtrC family response regulator
MGGSRVLVVEDDESLRRVIQAQLERGGYPTAVAVDASQALEVLGKQPIDVVLCDVNLPGTSGMELLKRVRPEYPATAVVMVTAYGTVETAVEAIKWGAYDYITKPVHPDELTALIGRVLERGRLIQEVSVLRSTLACASGFKEMIGESQVWRQVLDEAARIARTDATVYIHGETGTGKEVLAKAIHFGGARRDRPFVVISCGSIPRELLESELFGHIKGSFTGAMTHKKGKVEIADGGTVFLDEIGEMPLDLQVRVLRLVQEHEIEKLGATAPVKVNVRIISATHRNLKKLVETGAFREDLYYRLAVVPIELPALRDRKEDIPIFVEEFFQRQKMKYAKPTMQLPASLIPYFVNYNWPGNIRELENVIERIVLLGRSHEVALEDLPEQLRGENPPARQSAREPESAPSSFEAVERQMIIQALRRFGWNQSQAARHLDISRKTLLYRIAKYGIEKESSMPRSGENGEQKI